MRSEPNHKLLGRVDAAIVASLVIASLIVLATVMQPWIDARWLYMDTQTVGELAGDCCHIYDGAVSTLGIMLWAATASVALFSAFLCFASDQRRAAVFGLHGFLLSAFLALDDAYLLHEVAAPNLGVPQLVFLSVIGLAAVSYFAVQREFLRRSGTWVLGLSLVCFAISVGIDQIAHSIEPFWIVAEDGPKFIGIVAWFLYHLRAHAVLVLTAPRQS